MLSLRRRVARRRRYRSITKIRDAMKGKKVRLGELFSQLGLADLCARTGLGAGRKLRILAYHRVLDLGDEASYGADPELISASVADFDAQMRFVQRHFRPVRCADVIDALERDQPLPPRSVIVTFDDGHIDNYTNAYPILSRLGMPATIFVSTEYIGSDRMFWFDRIASLLYFAAPGAVRLDAVDFECTLGDVASRRSASDALLSLLKRIPDLQRRTCLAELEQRFASQRPSVSASGRHCLSWDEVRTMLQGGIEFASHTVSHPILSQLDDSALLHELGASRDAIRRETGHDVPVIAYPIGKRGAYDARVIQAAQRCGYRLGISYETGTNPARGFDRFELRRIAVERYTSLAMFKASLCLPEVFA